MKPKLKDPVRINLYLDRPTVDKLDAWSQSTGLSRSVLVDRLARGINPDEQAPPLNSPPAPPRTTEAAAQVIARSIDTVRKRRAAPPPPGASAPPRAKPTQPARNRSDRAGGKG